MADDDNKVSDEQYAASVFEEGGDLVINLQDVQEMKFENVPKGLYLAEIDSASYGMSNSSGKPMITLSWKIIDGQYENRKLLQWLSFSQGALPGTKANINRIAPELTTQAWKPQELCNNGFFIGKRAKIRVDLSEYNGEMRSGIKGLLAVGGEGEAFLSR